MSVGAHWIMAIGLLAGLFALGRFLEHRFRVSRCDCWLEGGEGTIGMCPVHRATTATPTAEPKPCPFCGSPADPVSEKALYVMCSNAACQLVGPNAGSRALAIVFWNSIEVA
jgi:hypothetical protein